MTRWLARLALVAWFLLALQFTSVDVRNSVLHSGQHPSVALALLMALPVALLSVGVVVAAIWLTARHPITGNKSLVGAAKHLLLMCAFGFAGILAAVGIRASLAQSVEGLSASEDWRTFRGTLAVYVIFAALAHAVEYARRHQRQHSAELRLQAELGQAELQRTAAELRMLKMQLNPHFLFNSLNALSLLITTAPAVAQRMVVELATLLRRAMHSVATQEVTVEEEVAGLLPFVEIERLRLAGGLTVKWAIAEEAREALVPHMVLQPLVENAIKHGIVPRGGDGRIRVAAAREGEWLTLTVSDNGVGLHIGTPGASETNGVGSANIQARLAQLYGTRYALELRADDTGDTVALVRLPWHRHPLDISAGALTQQEATDLALDIALPAPPPPSATFLRAELVVACALLIQRWVHGYTIRYTEAIAHGIAAPRLLALLFSGVHAVVMAAGLLAILRLSRAHPLSQKRWSQALRLHVLLLTTLFLVFFGERVVGNWVIGYGSSELTPDRLTAPLVGVVFIYVTIAGLAHALEYARRYRWKRVAELRLRAELGQAELQRTAAELRMLKMQLNPHFLFNSLNALSLLITTTPAVAQRMVVELATLLRQAMHSVATQEVTVEEEVAGLLPFVEIERLRLGGELTVEWAIAEEAREALVPHMVLQPLVENAIKHGIVPGGGRGRIRVAATREGEWLTLTVSDDAERRDVGQQHTAPTPDRNGVGAVNVQARLAQLYGTRHVFELQTSDAGGVALIRLPWHDELT